MSGIKRRVLAAVAPVGRPARRTVRRWTRASPLTDDRVRLVHCAHHKVGTVWFKAIYEAVANEWGLRFQRVRDLRQEPTADVIVYRSTSVFDRDRIRDRPFRGTHLIRDPRDVVVSGYFYHLWTDEAWALTPSEEWGGKSYQELLNGLSREEGMLVEIERAARLTLEHMGRWDYEQPEFLELRYEDIFGNEQRAYQRMFEHLGFTDDALERAVELADRYSFGRRTNRAAGEVQANNHIRSGQPDEWREHFSDDHKALFKELTGDLLVRLGYEGDESW